MIYPFIYTRTKYHDYRIVTSKSLNGLPQSIIHLAIEVARTLIDAENNQLIYPTWTLVKKEGYIFWGMAILNRILGEQSQDKYNRPIRGFFGIISDKEIVKLPYDTAYFKELYEAYVLPIWEEHSQIEEIFGKIPSVSGFDFIKKSSRLSSEINEHENICRLFPANSESKSLIEAVFASTADCSIATNIHNRRQCIEFGKDKFSFTNAIMSDDSNFNKIKNISVFVHKEIHIFTKDISAENKSDITDEYFCSICGKPVYGHKDVCTYCKRKKRNKRCLIYGVYGFIVLICLVFVCKGSSIWEKILSPTHIQETVILEKKCEKDFHNESPFLTTSKKKLFIFSANSKDTFQIMYNSSSPIIKVESTNNWIKIITQPKQFPSNGIIKFVCEPMSKSKRNGTICIFNKEGNKVNIPIFQTANDNFE